MADKRVGEKTKYTEYEKNWKEQLDGLRSDRILENQPKGKKKKLGKSLEMIEGSICLILETTMMVNLPSVHGLTQKYRLYLPERI